MDHWTCDGVYYLGFITKGWRITSGKHRLMKHRIDIYCPSFLLESLQNYPFLALLGRIFVCFVKVAKCLPFLFYKRGF